MDERSESILEHLAETGGAQAKQVAEALFTGTTVEVTRDAGYQLAYEALRRLERTGHVTRTRTRITNDGPTRYAYVWHAVGTVPPTRRRGTAIYRVLVLTERMHDVLIGVLNDACIDDPSDIDVRKVRNIVKSAALKAAEGPRVGPPSEPEPDVVEEAAQ